MQKKVWKDPEANVINVASMENVVKKVLTVESSLYASGCHHGMRIRA